MGRCNFYKIVLLLVLAICLSSCQDKSYNHTRFENVLLIADSCATKAQREEKKRIEGFMYNPKVTTLRGTKIILIANDEMFRKNNIDPRYREEILRQIDELNQGLQQWLEDGLITPEKLKQNFIDAQREKGKTINY